MTLAWRSVGILAIGALFGGLVAGWAVYENADALRAVAAPKRVQTATMRQEAPCPGAITLPASANDDARFQLVEAGADHKPADVRAFIVIGKEAAASGRPRDAELSFIMACRVASRPGTDIVLLADAKYQLARHFAENARGRDSRQAEDLRRRARVLFGDSLRIYAVRLGNEHEKATFAANGLAALDEPAARTIAAAQPAPAPAVAPAPAPAPPAKAKAPAAPVAPVPAVAHNNDTRVLGSAPAPAARPRPSFDCTRALSRTERLICADAQLSQLDSELGRLYAQAKAGAPDMGDFRRRSDAEWQRREQSCRDRGCLVDWYATRRAQLLDEIESQRARRHAAR
ncbi:lysozyme inhibitor LprI family protein [Ramlibacter sp. PS4R-6]|uniref:lysozyme inhibitor LprI family protein n=1 Tax=Ramlibacter sp. PS4R-6 TaxID=3133438 RepID=UPI0030A5A5A7